MFTIPTSLPLTQPPFIQHVILNFLLHGFSLQSVHTISLSDFFSESDKTCHNITSFSFSYPERTEGRSQVAL